MNNKYKQSRKFASIRGENVFVLKTYSGGKVKIQKGKMVKVVMH